MYYLLRFFVRLALRVYCHRVGVDDDACLKLKGPLVIASNHPNGFFDAIIIASRMQKEIYFLAWGEITDRWLSPALLKFLHIIPVYHILEHRHNQERNEKSFSHCVELLSSGGILLVFAEGVCENNWELRPFKKGTARVVLESLERVTQNPGLRILPAAINYNSYTAPCESIFLSFGLLMSGNDLPRDLPGSEKILLFNESVRTRISGSMLQSANKAELLQIMLSNITHLHRDQIKKLQGVLNDAKENIDVHHLKKPGYLLRKSESLFPDLVRLFLLGIPAALGWTLHFPLYYPLTWFAKKKTARSVFYDSLLFLSLFLTYPLYWIALNISVYYISGNFWLQIIFLFMPAFAWTTGQWFVQWQRFYNRQMLSVTDRQILGNLIS
jgi:1-acyl-sn-glycerol-3-phosphate acyltransferase